MLRRRKEETEDDEKRRWRTVGGALFLDAFVAAVTKYMQWMPYNHVAIQPKYPTS